MSPNDLYFIEASCRRRANIKHGAAREIALALGVAAPRARSAQRAMLLGIPGDNTFSNYQEANRTFWRQTVLPLVQRTTAAPRRMAGSQPTGLSNLALQPDLDDIPALASEREALWSRLEKSTFLTDDEKRAAVGYGPKAQNDTAKLFNPNQPRDPHGRWAPGDAADIIPAAGGRRPPPTIPPPGIGHNNPPGAVTPPTSVPQVSPLPKPTDLGVPAPAIGPFKPLPIEPVPGHSGSVFDDEVGARAPRGFDDVAQLNDFKQRLSDVLPPDVDAVMQGSAVEKRW